MSSTLNQSTTPLSLIIDGKYHNVNKVAVPGSSGEPVATKIYLNVSGTLKPGMFGGILDIRCCRNAVTDESSANFDETALITENVLGEYKNAEGLWVFKQYISRPWWTTRNYSSTMWQVRARAHILSATVKQGFYTGATDFE